MMLVCTPGPVSVVTIDRPPANAMNRGFFDELLALLPRLRDDPAVRAVVLTGTGRFFSAGLDLFEIFSYEPAAFDAFTGRFDAGLAELFAFPKPVVAAVNGHAIAGGALFACLADFRLLADGEGRLGLTEIVVGVPFPATALEVARFACAGPHLPELLYHGRTYSPREACERRLVDEVVPPAELMPRALALAGELAGREPAAFSTIKMSFRADAISRLHAVRDGGDPFWDVWRRPETRAAVAAFRERTLGRR